LLPCGDFRVGRTNQERCFRCGDHFGLREHVWADHRPEDNNRLAFENAIHCVQGVGARGAGVFCGQGQFLAADASACVDFIDRKFGAIARLGAEQRRVAGEGCCQAQWNRGGATCGFRLRVMRGRHG
jgi:hypothetical protein